MLIVVSPAKSLDLQSKPATKKFSQPRLLDQSVELVDILSSYSPDAIQGILSISDELADLNARRLRDWTLPFTPKNARQALLTFNGDTYQGMNATGSFGERDFTRAQKTLRILSGLYGVLRPLDLIQPYRLEMGTRLATSKANDLYQFWGDTLTEVISHDLAASPNGKFVVNLASDEYFRALRTEQLGAPVVTPRFLDFGPQDAQRREPKVISFHAKRARGAMAGWLIRERIDTRKALTKFDGLGYAYDKNRSTPNSPTFIRAT